MTTAQRGMIGFVFLIGGLLLLGGTGCSLIQWQRGSSPAAPETTGATGTVVAVAATGTVVVLEGTPTAPGVMTGEVAAAWAVGLAKRQYGPVARLDGEPQQVFGRMMTVAQAHSLLGYPPLEPVDMLWPHRNDPVWVVVIHGSIKRAEVNPPPTRQMIMVVDAKNGELIEASVRPTTHEIAVRTLPALTPATGPVAPPQPTPVRGNMPPSSPKPAPATSVPVRETPDPR